MGCCSKFLSSKLDLCDSHDIDFDQECVSVRAEKHTGCYVENSTTMSVQNIKSNIKYNVLYQFPIQNIPPTGSKKQTNPTEYFTHIQLIFLNLGCGQKNRAHIKAEFQWYCPSLLEDCNQK